MRRCKVVLALAAVMAAGCGEKDEMSAQEFSAKLQNSVAALSAKCYPNTAAQEREWMSWSVRFDEVGAAVEAGLIEYRRAKAEQCLDELAAKGCNELYFDHDLPASCNEALVGKVANGGECHDFYGAECAEGFCEVDACAAPGTCTAFKAAGAWCYPYYSKECGAGLTCDESEWKCVAKTTATTATLGQECGGGVICQEGLYCDGTCTTRIARGEECDGDHQCAIGNWCVGADGTSTCQPWKRVGASCTVEAWECVNGAYCAANGKCTAYPTVNGACGAAEGSEWRFCVESWCDFAPDSDVGTCKAYLPLGAACDPDPDKWDQCGFLGTCDEETSKCVEYYCND
jgi:hypothetical protein